MSDYYNTTGIPGTLTQGSSSAIRDQFTLTDQGFAKCAPLSGNGGNVVFIDSGGTSQESKTPADARTAMGAQTQDDGLDSIAALSTLADRMIYTTASDTYAVAVLTAVARTLLAAATVAAQRDALGLGASDSPAFAGLTIGGVPITPVVYNWGPVVTSNTTLVAGAGVNVNTAGGEITVNLPASMAIGDVFAVHHIDATDAGNICRVGENGNMITHKGVDQEANVTLALGDTVFLTATGTNTAEIV